MRESQVNQGVAFNLQSSVNFRRRFSINEMQRDRLPRHARSRPSNAVSYEKKAVLFSQLLHHAVADGKETRLFAPFCTFQKCIFLPRQARDKHRETSKGDAFLQALAKRLS
jgi:hypothetical protein